MRHKISDDINVNVNIEFEKEDVKEVLDKVLDTALAIIVVGTTASILRSWLTK